MKTPFLVLATILTYPAVAGAVVTKDCPPSISVELVSFEADSRANVAASLKKDLDSGAVSGVSIEALLGVQKQLVASAPASLKMKLGGAGSGVCSYRGEGTRDFGLTGALRGTFASGQRPSLVLNLWVRDARLSREVWNTEMSFDVSKMSADGVTLRSTESGVLANDRGNCDPETGGSCGVEYLGSMKVQAQL